MRYFDLMRLALLLIYYIFCMGKQLIKKAVESKRTSSRPIKKKKLHSDEEQFFSEGGREGSDDDDSPCSEQDSEEDSDQESSEESSVAPENMAVRNMTFREKRGTKMNYLITRKKQQEEDPFWAQQGQNFFGNLEDGDDDEEDYVESSSGRDEFDSDFDQTESQHQIQQGVEVKEVDQDHQKAKKKRHQLMKKIQTPGAVKKAQKTAPSSSAVKKQKVDSEKKIAPEATSKYIHEMFNQEELLGEAATTEYFNWLSLKKLISLETVKKDFSHRSHSVQGPKVIYRNKINPEGGQEVTYELSEVKVNKISDLTQFISQK